jgi:hypothetical protein
MVRDRPPVCTRLGRTRLGHTRLGRTRLGHTRLGQGILAEQHEGAAAKQAEKLARRIKDMKLPSKVFDGDEW